MMITRIFKKQIYIPLIVFNIVIGLFIGFVDPYGFDSLLFWFLVIHSGYVLNHLGVVCIFTAFENFFVIRHPNKIHVFFANFLSAFVTSFPLCFLLLVYLDWLTDVQLVWQDVYIRCLVWNFFITFSYGLWLQQKRVRRDKLSLATFFLVLFGAKNLWELFVEQPLNSSVANKVTLPRGLRTLLPYELKKAKEIIFLQADDHYLHVTTDIGKAYIRLRLKDAVAMLDALDRLIGMQIHRSYWVNFSYIKDVKSGEVILMDGNKFPLSKNKKEEFLQRLQVFQAPAG